MLNEQSLNTENGDFGDFVIHHKMFENGKSKRLSLGGESGSDLSDYDDNFAEEYRMKQLKMLGELQSIYDDKSQLTQQIN